MTDITAQPDLTTPEPDSTGVAGWVRVKPHGSGALVAFGGSWAVPTIETLKAELDRQKGAWDGAAAVSIDVAGIVQLDSAGAWTIHSFSETLKQRDISVVLTGVQDHHKPLFDIVSQSSPDTTEDMHGEPAGLQRFLAALGKQVVWAGGKGAALTNFVGLVTVAFGNLLRSPTRMRPHALVTQIELTGLRAIPIVGLLSFLIGVTIAYLMADQFRAYGLDVFTVNVLGLFVLREGAVLITAIVIAGRSGSAFTAEIGTMKVNEEIDAMQTLGLDPVEVLVLPRVIALVLTLPILVFFADIMGLVGGGVMTYLILDITPTQFIQQLKAAVGLDTFLVGLVKAPVHASIIAIVGCYEGFQVARSAESVGKQTTTSVVESIFLVIVATALFAVVFSILGI